MYKLEWPWQTMEPGIYFGVPFEEYLSSKCLNASGIKQILISEPDFWARSWMNPHLDDIDEETRAMVDGRAYHTRLLEGKEVFEQHYAQAFEDAGDKDTLRTNMDMTRFLRQNSVKGHSNKNAAQLAEMCRSVYPEVKILKVLQQEYEAQHSGKEFLDAKTWRHIEYTNKMVECHRELRTYFAGGYPEVTIIWDDPLFKVRFKIRIDYLKIKPVCDLKTFANTMGKNLDRAIEHAIASHKYHIQGWLYLRGVSLAKHLLREGKFSIHGDVDPEWMKEFIKHDPDEFWYVFTQKGIAPTARGVKWSLKDDGFNAAGKVCVEQAAEKFRKACTTYGQDYWVDQTESRYLDFSSLPAFVGDV